MDVVQNVIKIEKLQRLGTAARQKNSMGLSMLFFAIYLSHFLTQLLASNQLLTRITPFGIGS